MVLNRGSNRADVSDMAGLAPNLLLVEDDPDTAALICETLNDHFKRDCVKHCATVADAMREDLTRVDLVLSDMNLPDGTGMDVLMHVLRRWPDKPVVLVTGEGILENALAAIRRGAYDYVVKAGDYLFAIPIVVEKNLELHQIKLENTRLLDQLRHIAATDPLTGLANRRAFANEFERRFAEAERHDHDLACIMIDLDGFKQLNDTLGHPMGDHILERVGRVMHANCRQMDVAGRFGGDEFIVVLPQTDAARAEEVAHRIAAQFEIMASQELADTDVHVTVSFGIATRHGARPVNGEHLIRCADQALYQVKRHGKAGLHVYRRPAEGATGRRDDRVTPRP